MRRRRRALILSPPTEQAFVCFLRVFFVCVFLAPAFFFFVFFLLLLILIREGIGEEVHERFQTPPSCSLLSERRALEFSLLFSAMRQRGEFGLLCTQSRTELNASL